MKPIITNNGEFQMSNKFTYSPDTEIVYCHFTPTDAAKFDDWCAENGLQCTFWLGRPDEVCGVTAELFVLFKMTWD